MLKLLKVMAATGAASSVTMLLGLVTNKIAAVILGPTGVGLLSSYRVIQDTVTGLGVFGGSASQVQALSSTEGEARRFRVVACIWLAMAGMATLSVVLLVGAPMIADHFFRDPSPNIVTALRCMVVTFCLSVSAVLASSFVNVSGAIGWLALSQIGASLASVAAIWPLATLASHGSQLAYVGMLFVPLAMQTMIAGVMSWRLGWMPLVAAAFRHRPRRVDINHFVGYFVANLAGGLINSSCVLAVRAAIIEVEGQDANGLFQASWILTQQNLVLLVASFGTYLLPTLSATHDPEERGRFLNDTLPVLMVATVPMAGVGLLFMPLVLRLLYSEEFLPAMVMLRWMLLGNLFGAVCMGLTNLLLARNRPVACAVTEVCWFGTFAGISIAVLSGLIDPGRIGMGRLEAIGGAYFTSTCVRLVLLLFVSRTMVSYIPSADVWWVGSLGFGLLLFAAWLGWSAQTVDWWASVPSAALLCAAPVLLLNRRRRDRLRVFLRSRLRS